MSKTKSTHPQKTESPMFWNYLAKPVCSAALEGIFMAAPWGVLVVMLPKMWENRLSEKEFLMYFLLLTGLLGLRFLVSLYSNNAASSGGYETGNALRLRLGEHLRKLPMGFFSDRAIGELTNRVFMNVQMLEMMISHFLVQTVSSLVMPLMILVFLFWLEPFLALIVLGSFMMAGIFFFLLMRVLASLGKEKIQVLDKANATILEYLHGIKVFKSFNLTDTGLSRLHRELSRLRDFSLDLEVRAFSLSLSYCAILETGFVLVLLLGIWQTQKQHLSVPVLFSFLIVCRMFYRPLHELVTNAALTRATIADAAAVMDILRKPPVAVPESPVPVQGVDIEFCDVCFGYQKEKTILSHVSFRAEAKSLTALVGPSGSGKSTLASLAARFWEVDSGSICVGGVDIREIDPEVLLQHISPVFQDVYLFNDTIAGNIGMGRENATREEIVQAAKDARCHEFITALPDGYKTMVGEGGATLSGGEKQRIAIARALLKDAPIVLLDEATASLDAENDLLVQKAIDRLVRSKTVLVIAHRLYTIMNADCIVVLEKGRIRETGRHEELLAQNGLYARMWHEQQDFTPVE